jgi:Ca2+-transporting ATPase
VRHNLLRNKLLLIGMLAAQLIHIGAMYTPWLGDVLGAYPVSFTQWLTLLGLALLVMLVMELHKWSWLRRPAVSGWTPRN